nr:MAG TPA: hypothetical protein [Caudoviricetes sp.]
METASGRFFCCSSLRKSSQTTKYLNTFISIFPKFYN